MVVVVWVGGGSGGGGGSQNLRVLFSLTWEWGDIIKDRFPELWVFEGGATQWEVKDETLIISRELIWQSRQIITVRKESGKRFFFSFKV